MRAYSSSMTCCELAVKIRCSTSAQAADPARLLFLIALIAIAPDVVIWYCDVDLPAKKTALPLRPIDVNVAEPLLLANISPKRPPQPEVAPSGIDDCQ